jgi:hypothetical protein
MPNKTGSIPHSIKIPVIIPHKVSVLAKIKLNSKYKIAG